MSALHDAMRAVMATPEGRVVLTELVYGPEFGRLEEGSWTASGHDVASAMEGQRSVGRALDAALWASDPVRWQQALTERIDRIRREQELLNARRREAQEEGEDNDR